MKKIMFCDRYGLTEAVLTGRKTMTRRIVPPIDYVAPKKYQPRYDKGDVVAVAQRYKDVIRIAYCDESVWQFLVEKDLMQSGGAIDTRLCTSAGYDNKMFVRADLMPHRIRITSINVELLQDISDEDCLKEGVEKWMDCYIVSGIMERGGKSNICFDTPREAFSALIDRISGRGTWKSNPWVVAYEFELINKED